MTTNNKLLPCPFCGPGESVVSLYFDDVAQRYRVGCGRCGASTGIHPRNTSETPAISAWNTRQPAMPADAMAAVADRYAHVMAMHLGCILLNYSGPFSDEALQTWGEYRDAMNAIHEAESPTHMGEPLIARRRIEGCCDAVHQHQDRFRKGPIRAGRYCFQGKNMTTSETLLRDLVEALDGAFISTWQSTHAWQSALDEAREYLREQDPQEELK